MKNINLVSFVGTSFFLFALLTSSVFGGTVNESGDVSQGDIVRPQVVALNPEYVFIPTGFDNNDNSQIVLFGYLPNTCYRTGGTLSKIDEKLKKIYITHSAYLYSDEICLEVAVPYVQTIDLGILSEGHYEILLKNGNGQFQPQGEMIIHESKIAAADDHLYAPIEDAYVERLPGQTPILVLKGTFPNQCFSMNTVETIYTAHNIIEILPIINVHTGGPCPQSEQPFIVKVPLDRPGQGKTLIHIRSLNGQSVNKVIDL